MFIAPNLARDRLRARVYHPRKRKAEEKTPVRIQAGYDFVVFVLARLLEGVVPYHDASEVGNVFPLRQFPVDVKCVDGDVLIELTDDRSCFFIELCAVRWIPPIVEITLFVVLTSLIIKTVSDLVAEGRPANN